MTTDADATAAFWQAIHTFVEHLAAQVHGRWTVWAREHEKRHVHEVVGGLLARQAALASEFALNPPIWNAHSAPLFLRAIVENCITIAWILKDPDERAKQFIAYGLGQENLLLEHAKAEFARGWGRPGRGPSDRGLGAVAKRSALYIPYRSERRQLGYRPPNDGRGDRLD